VVVHVENDILAHDGQTDEGNIAGRFHKLCWQNTKCGGGGEQNQLVKNEIGELPNIAPLAN
jgi:hypothetical protein